jgi:MinD superfamily P-loop ATPase
MILTVASGKGGTGKTTVAVNLFTLLQSAYQTQFIDCDAEEPNAFLFLQPRITEEREVSVPVPEIDESLCNYCGLCAEVCQFNSLAVLEGSVLVFAEMCHGCGACSLLCPRQAITEIPRKVGLLKEGTVNGSPFTMGTLNTGEALVVPVIKAAKRKQDNIPHTAITIIDAPPGTSCPVIASVKGSDFVLLVTEATPFGLNDLDLAVQTMNELGISCGVLINRSTGEDSLITDYCRKHSIPLTGRIPFSKHIAEGYAHGRLISREDPRMRDLFSNLFKTIEQKIDERTRRH